MNYGKSAYYVRAAVLILAIAGVTAVVSIASASLTFNGSGVTGDTSVVIDGSAVISIGTSSATGITIGRTGIVTTFPGVVSITGNATTTNLSITSLAGASGCLSVSASGAVATTTCAGGSGGAVSTSSAITSGNVPVWSGASGALSGTSTLSLSGTTLTQSGTLRVTGSLTDGSSNPYVTSTYVNNIFSEGKNPGVVGNEVHKNLSISSGATATILSQVNGSGYISELFIASNQYATEVIVTVDGESTPSIDATVADLLGDDYMDTQPAFAGRWITGSNSGSGNEGGVLRLPIPFASSVKVQVKDNAVGTAVITSHVIYHTGVADTWPYTQRLHLAVVSADGIAADAESNMVNVTSTQPGRLAGIGWIYDGFPGSASPRSAGLEGAFKIYLDGSSTASFATGGSEDMFGEGWYFNNFTSFGSSSVMTLAPSTADIVLTVKSANTWGAQRFFMTDPIVFNNGLRATWFCGNTAALSFTGTCSLRASVYYYTQN